MMKSLGIGKDMVGALTANNSQRLFIKSSDKQLQ
jgi:hypothetical protein